MIEQAFRRAGVDINSLPENLQEIIKKEHKSYFTAYCIKSHRFCSNCGYGSVVFNGKEINSRDELLTQFKAGADRFVCFFIKHHALTLRNPDVVIRHSTPATQPGGLS